ncbi:transcriptional regulator with XRE-family HTH domain [Pseudochrobactrum saccharolyticum]|uniref:Transcriptional regulator with XRE-family HTH domain n=1 Tax=Pseudochrobactrum saccharolyticum TaxID=354352 RepID=A0A7W8ALQ5_9HYPH|nr:helix-turn-helix transcriptional regulator [Pseudochrobactrum saccharolyticum]MBB5092600.1 transcriptional regulator with XRE-family HTH domain [Pseudochrobactrum saccharolyticum]
MDDLRKRFGQLLAVHRRRAGLTQSQLAEAADISVDMVTKIETGTSGARFPVIEKLARALNADPAEFFTPDLPTKGRDNPALMEMKVMLSGLDEKDLLWVKSIIDAALNQKK